MHSVVLEKLQKRNNKKFCWFSPDPYRSQPMLKANGSQPGVIGPLRRPRNVKPKRNKCNIDLR